MNEFLNEQLQQIMMALISILVSLLITFGLYLQKRVRTYLEANLSAKQMEILHTIGQEAYAKIETTLNSELGHRKMEEALNYFEQRSREKGIPFDAEKARDAINKAWLETEGIRKRSAQPVVQNVTVDGSLQDPEKVGQIIKDIQQAARTTYRQL